MIWSYFSLIISIKIMYSFNFLQNSPIVISLYVLIHPLPYCLLHSSDIIRNCCLEITISSPAGTSTLPSAIFCRNKLHHHKTISDNVFSSGNDLPRLLSSPMIKNTLVLCTCSSQSKKRFSSSSIIPR